MLGLLLQLLLLLVMALHLQLGDGSPVGLVERGSSVGVVGRCSCGVVVVVGIGMFSLVPVSAK